MAVTRVEIRSVTPFADGVAFGDAGPYERLDGVLHVAVDPAGPANQGIVDLERAERGADGLVHFQADLCLLRPADPARGNRRLLLDVLNRGRKVAVRQLNRGPVELEPTERIEPGDGFLMRHGWTLVWCGWQWDVVRSAALLGLEAPQAMEDGRPIEGELVVHFQPNESMHDHLLADRVHRPYPAADVEQADAELTVRDGHEGARTVIARERWRFARDEGGRPVADDTRVWLEGGFEPGRIYEVRYRTRTCPVAGTGLLAVRDAASFLRYADSAAGNPCAGRLDEAYAFGVSQSGRFLRNFLHLGLNVDEAGRQVFDGVLPHVAGARRGEFNHRYAQPSVQYTPSFGHRFPFSDGEQTDPVTEETDGLLRRQRERGGVPRIFYTNSGAEYWRGDASLLHTDITGEEDIEWPAESRSYYFAGTQHGPGSVPPGRVSPNDGAVGAHPFNVVDYSPLLRAALTNLARWVSEGEEPPPTAVPRLADGTAATARDVLAAFPRIPGATIPDPDALRVMRRLDLGPRAAEGVGRFPAALGEAYSTYVSAIDADGNELAGLRLPELTVPVATCTPWNPRDPSTGGAGQIMPMLGSTFPLPATAADRARSGDPRLSIEERYRDRDEFLTRVRAEAEALAAQRYVLAEDVELVFALSAARYDAFARSTVATGEPRSVAAARQQP